MKTNAWIFDLSDKNSSLSTFPVIKYHIDKWEVTDGYILAINYFNMAEKDQIIEQLKSMKFDKSRSEFQAGYCIVHFANIEDPMSMILQYS
jgi:hypothetical protein